MAAQLGWGVDESEQKLREVSEKARECAGCRDEGNAHVNASTVAAAAEHGRKGRWG
jgi:hypothetical protein